MSEPFVARSGNLSRAWTEVFEALMAPGMDELGLTVVSIDDFDQEGNANEVDAIRRRLDAEMVSRTGRSIDDVANTIFPMSMWNRAAKDRGEQLFARFNAVWPRLRRRTRLNASGVYFQRLIAYEGSHGKPINQLGHIISTFLKGNHRRSALQATIFDPRLDHGDMRQKGFPCLQQVAMAVTSAGVELSGYYVMQHSFTRAYGNYLGLCRLGLFIADALGERLSQVICISSHAVLGRKKNELRALNAELSELCTTANPRPRENAAAC